MKLYVILVGFLLVIAVLLLKNFYEHEIRLILTAKSSGRLHSEVKPDPSEVEMRYPSRLPDHLQDVDQKDAELIEYIREHWIMAPTGARMQLDPKGWISGGDFSEQGQTTIVLDLLAKRRQGFFVECGAADGQHKSNSLYLELFMNWTGIMIEAEPEYFAKLKMKKNRNAFLVNACLSPSTRTAMLNFSSTGSKEASGLTKLMSPGQKKRQSVDPKTAIQVQCLPLYSILAALNIRHVDYFSLDVEGAELQVLKTIPFTEVTIDVISVEKRVVEDEAATEQKVRDIIALLSPYGYNLTNTLILDIILARNTTLLGAINRGK